MFGSFRLVGCCPSARCWRRCCWGLRYPAYPGYGYCGGGYCGGPYYGGGVVAFDGGWRGHRGWHDRGW